MTPLALADAVALPPTRPSPERVMRLVFGGRTSFHSGDFAKHRVGAIGSIEVSAIVERMWQQGPHVALLLDVAGVSLVYAPRTDDPDDGATVLTDLVGWILPDDLPIGGPFRVPSVPDGAIPVAFGAYLAAELADLGVHADERAAIGHALALFELLARHQGQAPGELSLATLAPHRIDEPAGAAIDLSTIWPALPVAGDVADVVAECDLSADLAYNAGGYYRVLSSCRLLIDSDRWAFVRVPRAIETDPGMALS